MTWKNVKLIFAREMRDQLRDRRTLFLIAVLPLLLYPLLGMSFFQLSQFLRNTAAKVLIVGQEELSGYDWMPKLVKDDKFHCRLFKDSPMDRDNLQIVSIEQLAADMELGEDVTVEDPVKLGANALELGRLEVVIYFPPGFGNRLQKARDSLMNRDAEKVTVEAELPEPQILFKSASEKSRIAEMRVDSLLRNWRHRVMKTNLRDSNVPMEAARPFNLQPVDVAEEQQKQAAVWSKILPFVLLIWALTGAFYPAVDLCAGEKERGTLETLLVSPAKRREIVWGKLFTIMTFSVLTALLNLGSLGLTGKFVLAQFKDVAAVPGQQGLLSLPPIISVVWLVLALIPVSALFSALCLACAAFARSTKEGQYYLMPLLLVIMPLMMLPLSPGVELNLGNSLIPMTGVVLLLRSMIEGQYMQALPYVIPVVGVTFLCCLLAIRWAEEQFNSESVLFRESERLDLRRWLVHLVRDRAETPSFAQAIFCCGFILILKFVMDMAISSIGVGKLDFQFFFQSTFILQVVCIAMPAVLMALLFTNKRKKTLLIDHWPHWSLLLCGAGLAIFFRPLGLALASGISQLYPISSKLAPALKQMESMMDSAPSIWLVFALISILPAICEELAFRGFILSGLRHVGHKWWAIGISAVAFGMVHPILQQQIAAAAVGLLLGYLAIQTGSLVVCMLFHAIYNALALVISEASEDLANGTAQPIWNWILSSNGEPGEIEFQHWVLALSAIGTIAILWWLHRLPYQRSKEEQLHEVREKQFAGA